MISKRKVLTILLSLLYLWGLAGLATAEEKAAADEKPAKTAEDKPKAPEPEVKPEEKPAAKPEDKTAEQEAEESRKKDDEEAAVAVARPVSADPVQVYGWREWVIVSDGKHEQKMQAKLDTGALTSSIHVEEKSLFERDGKKWVRFVVTDPGEKDSKRLRIEAPLIRIARIKEPGGESEAREVVRLGIRIGDRKMRTDFTLNNRSNMLSPILIGRRAIKELGWVDASRAYLADKKVMR
ncbi:MAG: RimK/LysX family protein [Verrucomicrobiota bacterium]